MKAPPLSSRAEIAGYVAGLSATENASGIVCPTPGCGFCADYERGYQLALARRRREASQEVAHA